MTVEEFVSDNWNKAVLAESRLNIPASYLLAHAAIETNLGISKSGNLVHGFEVVIPKKISLIKQFFVSIFNKIKSFFIKEKQVVIKDIIFTEDNVSDFFNNVSYHAKFQYLQSVEKFSSYIYSSEQNLVLLLKKKENFEEMVYKILKIINS